jgi:hypothetical protein
MARLSIREYCKTSRVTRGDGAQLRHAIEEHWDAEDQLVLDFTGVRIASVSFFDESLGLLALLHPLDELTRRVRVEGMNPADRALLNNIVMSRSRERKAADVRGGPPSSRRRATPSPKP